MKETYSYLGHSIHLQLECSQQVVRCTYFIDQRYCFEVAIKSPDVAAVRSRALEAAYRSIAMLDAARPSTSKHHPISSPVADLYGAVHAERDPNGTVPLGLSGTA